MVLISFGTGRFWHYPVLFVLFIACTFRRDQREEITFLWKDGRAVGITIPNRYLTDIPGDSIAIKVEVHLDDVGGGRPPAILGEFYLRDGTWVFTPVIPLTAGLTYSLRVSDTSIAKISVPVDGNEDPPEVETIFPTQDTLPSNLLKVYLQFSRPMQVGKALGYVSLLKNSRDTIAAPFLDLQPELWNGDHTMLTLWLDPGRIKRDLQPNRRLGNILSSGTTYRLVVSSDWKDARGVILKQDYVKVFFVATRDSLPPNVQNWKIHHPGAGTRSPLVISLRESLDGVLLGEAIRIVDFKGTIVSGISISEAEETILEFTPNDPWEKGEYSIRCEGRLEDLAGNNLNRAFDRDLAGEPMPMQKEYFERKFQIE